MIDIKMAQDAIFTKHRPKIGDVLMIDEKEVEKYGIKIPNHQLLLCKLLI